MQHRLGLCALRRGAAAVGALALVLVIGVSCSPSTEVIDRLTIVNDTEFDVEVRVSNEQKESWQILGRATHESSTVSERVSDMGPRWLFQFHYAGEVVGELTVTRDDLEQARWRVEVPSSVARTMRRVGFEPPPDD